MLSAFHSHIEVEFRVRGAPASFCEFPFTLLLYLLIAIRSIEDRMILKHSINSGSS